LQAPVAMAILQRLQALLLFMVVAEVAVLKLTPELSVEAQEATVVVVEAA